MALTDGFGRAFTVGAGFAVAGAILSMILISSRESRRHVEAAQAEEAAQGEEAAAVA